MIFYENFMDLFMKVLCFSCDCWKILNYFVWMVHDLLYENVLTFWIWSGKKNHERIKFYVFKWKLYDFQWFFKDVLWIVYDFLIYLWKFYDCLWIFSMFWKKSFYLWFFYDSEGRALPGPSVPEIINFIINPIINES